ncbi:MAG: bifunctional hydroxymethylpyrimidine kinase/phosphomethylpyrimidine kinase [Muribaculaceae bacterium]|nr:bifunctional hydroxymethylpyrimidine kinase/phosphomethylpyrimidine kinase [Muribaculaceae bacterium]
MYGRDTISTVLTIAGSDNTGGAGIQADIKTASAFGVNASTVVTAITAQRRSKVKAVQPVDLSMVELQLKCVFETFTPDAIKVGMLPTVECVDLIAQWLRRYDSKNIVIDPIIVSENGEDLKGNNLNVFNAIKEHLFPIATLVTPNFEEALAITGQTRLDSPKDFGKALYEQSGAKAVLLKGGDSKSDYCTDILFSNEDTRMFRQSKLQTENTHGTGSVLSTAIACGLAKGFSLPKAVRMAKDFVSFAIQKGIELNLSYGDGPLYLFTK